jgi:hypothetical protein
VPWGPPAPPLAAPRRLPTLTPATASPPPPPSPLKRQGDPLRRVGLIIGEFGTRDDGDNAVANRDTTTYTRRDRAWLGLLSRYLRALSKESGPVSWMWWSWNVSGALGGRGGCGVAGAGPGAPRQRGSAAGALVHALGPPKPPLPSPRAAWVCLTHIPLAFSPLPLPQANSVDTKGLVGPQTTWREVQWTKIRLLIREFGLVPWYCRAAPDRCTLLPW